MEKAGRPGSPRPAIQPKGFRADWGKDPERFRGGSRERAGSTSSAQLHAGDSADKGTKALAGRLWKHHRPGGELYMINQGSEKQGFFICTQCGKRLDKQNESHYPPEWSKSKCSGKAELQPSVLAHSFLTDTVLLAPCLPDGLTASPLRKSGRAALLSLGAAIVQAAATHLQIDPSELAVGMRPWTDPDRAGHTGGEIFLYDTLPNGAGYAREIYEELELVLKKALDHCTGCPAKCETACYRCLLDYGNQREHALLDRHLAADLLSYLLHGTLPTLSASLPSIRSTPCTL